MRMTKDDEDKSFHLTKINVATSKNYLVDAVGILACKYSNKSHFNHLVFIVSRHRIFGYFIFFIGDT